MPSLHSNWPGARPEGGSVSPAILDRPSNPALRDQFQRNPPVVPCARVPELLAPAGNWDCARAAVENGADAIYFGLERFNARMRAANFIAADLPRLMEFLHRRGVKGYVTFNTLVFADELAAAEAHLRTIITAGVDAAIVQDVGVCRLIRQLSPDFPIHASTQMTITSAEGVRFARELGCRLVVLARECSIAEIEKIRAALQGDPAMGTELEVFVHGALCVAYSGQCLTSESLGGRSANRGECAQACRLPYDLISDGAPVPLGDRQYLLSPQDLAGLDVLPDLARAGVSSLKIEGRLKSPEYVASVTRVYRRALDRLAGADDPGGPAPDQTRYQLEMAFSRGLSTGWLRGINNQALVHGRFGKKRGVLLGDVEEVDNRSIALELRAPVKPGDGIVIEGGTSETQETGGRVYSLDRAGRLSRIRLGPEVVLERVRAGNRVWKTSDPALERELRMTFTRDTPQHRQPIQLEVHGAAEGPMTVLARDPQGHVAEAQSAVPLAAARTQPLTEERLREQLGRLGGTAFRLDTLQSHLTGELMLPMAELNRLRRECVAQLETQRAQPKRWILRAPTEQPSAAVGAPAGEPAPKPPLRVPELIVLVRTLPQLETVLAEGATTLYCEFEDPKKYREAVAICRRHPLVRVYLAPPRIYKSGEDWVLRLVRSAEPDGYLVRNYDHLAFFRGCEMIGDFSLNVANPLSAEYYRAQYGLARMTVSYDLNAAQVEALLQTAPPDWFEITLHQHMPMFHMEHCVFCAFLSSGTDYTNCGRPCDHHDVRLRDRVGAEHILRADAGCRNTLFNAAAQSGAEHADRFLRLGARYFRVEFLNEPPNLVQRTLDWYRKLLRGDVPGSQVWRELKAINHFGVTRGAM